MNILAIETSGKAASVALLSSGNILADFTINNNLTHSQILLNLIDNIFTATGFNKNLLDYIACSNGPGSFTGLRIGAAVAKGLAFGLGIKIIPVKTLDVLAYNIFTQGNNMAVVPIMDARRNQVYTAIYSDNIRQTDYLACDISEIIDETKKMNKPAIFLGDAVAIHKEKILLENNFSAAPLGFNLQKAAAVASVASSLAQYSISPKEFSLFYIRVPQAEREAAEREINN